MNTTPNMGTASGPSVPVEALRNDQRRQPPGLAPFAEHFSGVCDRFAQSVADGYRKIQNRHRRAEDYLQGNHFRDIDPQTGKMYEVRPSAKWAHVNNHYEVLIGRMIGQTLKSQPRFVVKSKANSRTAKANLKAAQHFIDSDRILSAEEQELEILLLATRARVWYRTTASLDHECMVKAAIFSQATLGDPRTAFYCPRCQQGGYLETDQAPVCPQCENTAIMVQPGQAVLSQSLQGYQDAPTVNITTELYDELCVRWYYHSGMPRNTPWLEVVRFVLVEELQNAFPWANLSTGVGGEGNLGHLMRDELQKSAGNFHTNPYVVANNSTSAPEMSLRRELKEVWLRPVLYKALSWPTDIEFANGLVIPARTPLGTVFPKGMYLAYTGQRLLHVWPKAIEDEWEECAFRLNPSGGHARGTESLISLQDRLNLISTQQVVHLATTANGAIIIDPRKITSASARKNLFSPGQYAIAEGLMPGERAMDAIHQIQPAPLSAAAYELEQRTLGHMQDSAGVYSTSPNVDKAPINTATGVNEMAEQIAMAGEPLLRRRAETWARISMQRLKLAARYFGEGQERAIKPFQGRERSRTISSADLEGDFFIELDPQSHVIRTNSQRRNDVVAGMQLLGPFLSPGSGLAESLIQTVLTTFGLDEISDEVTGDWSHIANRRIDQMIQACHAMAPQMQNLLADAPATAQADPQPNPIDGEGVATGDMEGDLNQQLAMAIAVLANPQYPEDDAAFIRTYVRFYGSDEGQDAPDILKQAIILTIQAHEQAIISKAQKQTADQIAIQQPAMQLQAEQQQMQAQERQMQGLESKEREGIAAQEQQARSEERDERLAQMKIMGDELSHQRMLERDRAKQDGGSQPG